MEILYGVPDMDDFIDDTIKRCLLDYDLGRQDTETVLEDMERERTLEKSGKEDKNQDVASDIIDSHDSNNNKSKKDIGSSSRSCSRKPKSRINSNISDIDEVQSRKSPQTPTADPTSNYGVLFRTIEKSKAESDDNRCSSSQREHCNYMVTSPSSVPDLSRGQGYFHSDQDSDDGELMRKETRGQSPKMASTTMKLKSRLQERYFRSSRDATPDLPSDSEQNRKSVSPSGSSSSDSKYTTSSNDHSLNISDNSSNSLDDRCLHSLKRNVHGELLVNGNSAGRHASRKADPTSNRRSSDPTSDATWTNEPLDNVARMGRQHSEPSSAVTGVSTFATEEMGQEDITSNVYPTPSSSNKVNFHIEVLNRLKQQRIVPQKEHSGKCREKKQLKSYRNLKQKKIISSDLTPVQYLVAKRRDNTNNISQQDCPFSQFKNNQESPLKSQTQRDQELQGFYQSHLHQRQTNNYTTSNNEAEVQRRYAQLRQLKRDAENLRNFNGSNVRSGDRTRPSQPNPLTRIANFNENSGGENILSERLAAPPQSAHSHQASIPNDLSRREYQHHHQQYHYPSVISRPEVHSVSPPTTTSSPNVAAPVPSQPPPLLRVTFSPLHQALNGLTNHHQQQHQHHHQQQQQQQHHLVAGPTALSMVIGREDRVHQHQNQNHHHQHHHQDVNSAEYRFPRVYGSDHYPVSSASPIHDDYDVPQDLTMKSSVR